MCVLLVWRSTGGSLSASWSWGAGWSVASWEADVGKSGVCVWSGSGVDDYSLILDGWAADSRDAGDYVRDAAWSVVPDGCAD